MISRRTDDQYNVENFLMANRQAVLRLATVPVKVDLVLNNCPVGGFNYQ